MKTLAETIALVGGETLLGREVREVFGETALGRNLQMFGGEPEAIDAAPGEKSGVKSKKKVSAPRGEIISGKLIEIDGAAEFLARFTPDALRSADFVILAGGSLQAEALEANPDSVVIDLTYALEDRPDARLRAPLAEGGYENDDDGPVIVAHPAAVAIAMVLSRLNTTFPITNASIHIFEPASERGKPGIDELQAQTLSLFSFQEMPKKVFDTQLSFAMLPKLGQGAAPKLEDIEERIERHLATLLDRLGGLPMPSLRLVQAPVFHGHSFSMWVEFEDAPSVAEIEDALAGEGIDVRSEDLEAPSNIGVAGQSGVTVGSITPDRNNGNAAWIWMAADNLRLMAENAAAIVRERL